MGADRSSQALTYTQTVFGQVVTRTVPAGQTITNVIPRPTPTGPTIVYVTEDPGSNQPVTGEFRVLRSWQL